MTKNLLVVGTDPIQLQDYCLQELARHTKNKQVQLTEPAFIIVPDALKADMERRYLTKFNANGLMLAEVLSFQRLAYRLFSIAGGLAVDSISSVGKSLLIQKIICQNPSHFKQFQYFAGKIGFSRELEKVLRDFKRFDFQEAEIEGLSKKAPPSLTKDKLSDFFELFYLYEQALEQLKLIDQDDNIHRLLTLLADESNEDLNFLKKTKIWITGFADIRSFNQQELKLIQRLASLTKTLTITVCTDISPSKNIKREIFEPGYRAFKQLISAVPNLEKLILPTNTPSAQSVLQETLLTGKIEYDVPFQSDKTSQKKKPIPRTQSLKSAQICLITNENQRQEWVFIAGEIKRLLKEENYRQKEIGIAVSSAEKNQNLIKSIFREFGLNAYITERIPLKQLPLYRHLEGFLQICNGDYQFEDILLYLRSGLTAASLEDIDEFENICLEFGFKFPAQLENPKYLLKIPEESRREFFSNFIANYLQDVFAAAKDIRSYRKASEKARFLRQWLGTEIFFNTLEKKIDRLRKIGEEDMALSLAAAFDMTLQLLEESELLFDLENISQARFSDIILGALAMQIPGTIPIGLDRIRIGSMQELMYYDCKILFIVGMSSDNFPPTNMENGFFNSSEIEWIENVSKKQLPDYKKNQILAGLVNTAALFSHPKERIYLSTPYPDSQQWASLYALLFDLLQTDIAIAKNPFEETKEVKKAEEKRRNKIRFIKKIGLVQINPAANLIYPDQRWLTQQRAARYLKTQALKSFDKPKEKRGKKSKPINSDFAPFAKAIRTVKELDNSEFLTEKYRLPQNVIYWHKAVRAIQMSAGNKEEQAKASVSFNPLINWRNVPENRLCLNLKSYRPILKQHRFLSASRLESYQACPYQYFAQNILNLQERPAWEIDQKDRGTMVHAMMETALKEFEKAMLEAVDKKHRESVYQSWLKNIQSQKFYDELYEKAFQSAQLHTYADAVVKAKDGKRLKRIIRSALMFDSYQNLNGSFLPSYFEWQFPAKLNRFETEQEQPYQPLYLLKSEDLSGESIVLELNGIIDRVDLNDSRQYRIFDYKTGKKDVSLEAIYYGLDLQLGLYQKIWQINHPEYKADTIAYFLFENPIEKKQKHSILPPESSRNERLANQKLHRKIKASEEQLKAIGEFTYRQAQQSTKNIAAGIISPNPKGLKIADLACRYCSYKEICGYDQRLVQQRAAIFEPSAKSQDILAKICQEIEQDSVNRKFEDNN